MTEQFHTRPGLQGFPGSLFISRTQHDHMSALKQTFQSTQISWRKRAYRVNYVGGTIPHSKQKNGWKYLRDELKHDLNGINLLVKLTQRSDDFWFSSVVSVPPTICFTWPPCESIHGLNLVMFFFSYGSRIVYFIILPHSLSCFPNLIINTAAETATITWSQRG